MAGQEKNQKIGILGGTFDPVHKGHREVAQTVLGTYGLDRILLLPAFSPPHKGTALTPFSHRVAMLETAFAGDERMEISILEAERNAPSYTVETLLELHRRMKSCGFYLIMGADMFVEIELWYQYRRIFELASVIVVSRPGISDERIAEQVQALPGRFCFEDAEQTWFRADGAGIYYCRDVSIAVSSTEVRRRLANGESVEMFLAAPVIDYIQQHGLYQT